MFNYAIFNFILFYLFDLLSILFYLFIKYFIFVYIYYSNIFFVIFIYLLIRCVPHVVKNLKVKRKKKTSTMIKETPKYQVMIEI